MSEQKWRTITNCEGCERHNTVKEETAVEGCQAHKTWGRGVVMARWHYILNPKGRGNRSPLTTGAWGAVRGPHSCRDRPQYLRLPQYMWKPAPSGSGSLFVQHKALILENNHWCRLFWIGLVSALWYLFIYNLWKVNLLQKCSNIAATRV